MIVDVLRNSDGMTEAELAGAVAERLGATAKQGTTLWPTGIERKKFAETLWDATRALHAIKAIEFSDGVRSLTEFGRTASTSELRAALQTRRDSQLRVDRFIAEGQERDAQQGVLRVLDRRSEAEQSERWYRSRLMRGGYTVWVEPHEERHTNPDGILFESISYYVMTDLRCSAEERRRIFESLERDIAAEASRAASAREKELRRKQRREVALDRLIDGVVRWLGYIVAALLVFLSLLFLPGARFPARGRPDYCDIDTQYVPPECAGGFEEFLEFVTAPQTLGIVGALWLGAWLDRRINSRSVR